MRARTEIEIRKGLPGDCRTLAELMNIAGEGIPAHVWAGMAGPGSDVMEFGAVRVGRMVGDFSFLNVQVASIAGAVAGMVLTYLLPDPYEIGRIEDYPEVVRPLVELEAQAPGSWYVNAVATFAPYRGRGVATRLLTSAESLARQVAADKLSLIVAEENVAATRLYRLLGYQTVARRPTVPFPGFSLAGDWILMLKSVTDPLDALCDDRDRDADPGSEPGPAGRQGGTSAHGPAPDRCSALRPSVIQETSFHRRLPFNATTAARRIWARPPIEPFHAVSR